MPTTGSRFEDQLVDLFLSEYQDGSWAVGLSDRDPVERYADAAVEMVATRKADGRTLAIEHTLIEPFIGDKTDYHSHFKQLEERLRSDSSLRVPGFALYIEAPVGVLPRGSDRDGIISDVTEWLRKESRSFPPDPTLRVCPAPHHPAAKLTMRVRLVALDSDPSRTFVIVQRYGEMKVEEAVAKALTSKLKKLAATTADVRILLLERENSWVDPDAILDEVERLRSQFPALSAVTEVWIADTASFGEKGRYVAFHRGRYVESFEFWDGVLSAKSNNGMPIMVPRRD